MSNLNEQFRIELLQDNIYQVIEIATDEMVKQGTIEEVNAWLDMYAKGFVL